MVKKESMKFFISGDVNIFYSADQELEYLIKEVSSLLNVIRCSGKFRVLDTKSNNPNKEYNNQILSSPSANKIQKKIISSIESNIILKNKVVVLELFTSNRDIVNTAFRNSNLNYREMNDLEELQLQIGLESNLNIGIEELGTLVTDTEEKILLDKKLLKKAGKVFKNSSAPVEEYAKAHILENYTPSLTEIVRDGIRYNTHDERYYVLSNLLHLKDTLYPLKFIFDLDVELCISFQIQSKSEVVSSVKRTIGIEKQNLLLKKRINDIDKETADNTTKDLTDSGTHYNTTLNALFKTVIILKSKNLEDDDTINSTLIGNNIEVYNLDGIHEEGAEIFNLGSTFNLRSLPSFFTSSTQLADLLVIPPEPIAEPRGVFLGYNKSKKPVYLNLIEYFFGRTSFNFMIDGTMGQGKSNTVKKILSQLYCHPEFKYLYILDPDSEYSDLVTALGGTVKKYDKKNATNFLHLKVYSGAAADMIETENEKELNKSMKDSSYKAQVVEFESDESAAIFEKVQFLNKVFEILIDKEGDSPSYKVDLIVSFFNRIYKHYFSSNTSREYTLSFSESIK
ncbi:MAG: helicase HerA domain-containing protein [Bacilli bacterium]